jgi:hypothetical protein
MLALLLLGGCVSVEKVATGERLVGERMTVQIEGPWNHVNLPNNGPAQQWTMEGLAVDQLLLYSGIKNGELIHREFAATRDGQQKSFSYRSNMQPEDIVAAFEGMLTHDGSRFRMVKLEPVNFGGGKGFRFEFQLVRKINNLTLNGVGYSASSKGELFTILYLAPRLTFYQRHVGTVEKIAASARIKE